MDTCSANRPTILTFSPPGQWLRITITLDLTEPKGWDIWTGARSFPSPGVMADAYGFPARGRQIMLQVTLRPHLL